MKWNEMNKKNICNKWMNELIMKEIHEWMNKKMNWNESTEKNEVERMNWNECSELEWTNWNEKNWNEWTQMKIWMNEWMNEWIKLN